MAGNSWVRELAAVPPTVGYQQPSRQTLLDPAASVGDSGLRRQRHKGVHVIQQD
jgi:hypothetical protein